MIKKFLNRKRLNIYEEEYVYVEKLVFFDRVEKFKSFLKKIDYDIKNDPWKLLSLSYRYFSYKIADYLISNGADIHIEDDYPLRWMALNGELNEVKKLVSLGANIRAKNNHALALSSLKGHLDVVRFLIENGANADACIQIMSGLIRNKKIDVFKYLFDHVSLNISYSIDILVSVFECNKVDIFEYLLDKGKIDINNINIIYLIGANLKNKKLINRVLSMMHEKQNINHFLIASASGGNMNGMKAALSFGADIYAEKGLAVARAIRSGNYRTTKYLIEKMDNISEKGSFLHIAAESKNLKIVKLLIKKGIDIHINDDDAFIEACRRSCKNIIKYLLNKGANINAQEGRALIHACTMGEFDIVRLLVKNGADVNVKNGTPLIAASIYFDIVKYLVEKGANVCAQNSMALINSVRKGNLKTIKYLIDKGADPFAHGQKAFVNACVSNDINIVKYFIELGIDISYNNNEALTAALREAASKDVLMLLLERGAYTEDLRAIMKCILCNYIDILKIMKKNNKENFFIHEDEKTIFAFIKNKRIILTPFGTGDLETFLLSGNGFDESVKRFIKRCERIININNPKYREEFSELCKENNFEKIMEFINDGFKLDCDDLLINLKNLIMADGFETFKIIIKNYLDRTIFDCIKDELFLYSVEIGNMKFIRYFIDIGMDLYVLENEILYTCVLKENEEILKFFESLDDSIIHFKDENGIILYLSNQDIVFCQYFEGSLEDFKDENPVAYKMIINKIKTAI